MRLEPKGYDAAYTSCRVKLGCHCRSSSRRTLSKPCYHPAVDIDLDIYSLVARPSKAAAAFAEDGEINIELSAISATTGSGLSTDPATDRINVAAGTDERAYTVDCVYDVQPTAYQNNDTSGGNRVWIEFYAKKNGNDILASHDTKYMRHRNPWAPTSQTFNMSFDTTLTADDYLTFHFRRRGTYGGGAEIERWQINGTTCFTCLLYTSPSPRD